MEPITTIRVGREGNSMADICYYVRHVVDKSPVLLASGVFKTNQHFGTLVVKLELA